MKLVMTVVTILLPCLVHQAFAAGAGGQVNADLIPPLMPSADEIRVRAVPAFSIHVKLDECLQSAERVLADPAHVTLHTRVGDPFITLNRNWGYLLRADFTRDDVAPPSVNRILCWSDGQLIASKLSVPLLASIAESSHPLAVPGARPH
jgi:hypothetical protein